MVKRIVDRVTCAMVPLLLLAFSPGFATAAPVAGLSFTGQTRGHTDSTSRMIGWQFTVGDDPIVVESLGYQDFGQDGLLTSHEVGVWSLADQTLLASAVVPGGTAGVLDGFFRYAALGAPVTLDPGATYVIAGLDNGQDPHVWDAFISGGSGQYVGMEVDGFAVDPAILLGPPGSAYGPAMSVFDFPVLTVGGPRAALMGPNLRYTVESSAPVPEPSSLAVFLAVGAALGCVSRRTRRSRA